MLKKVMKVKSMFFMSVTIIMVLSMTFILNPIYGAEVEMLVNKGFEEGNIGWLGRSSSFSVTDSQSHSGSYCGKSTNRTSSWMGIKQSLLDKLSDGGTYEISGWVKTSGTSDSVKISVEQSDGNGTNYIEVATGIANNSEWTELSGTFTYNPNGIVTTLDVYFEGPAAGIDLYVDDASVFGEELVVEKVDTVIDLGKKQQSISGFGASSAWCGALSDDYMDTMFDTQGLSIVRLRIAPNDNWKNGDYSAWSNEVSNAKKAIERGAIVFASPWTPPAYMKTNNNTVGGSLSSSYYEEYANYLKAFADHLNDNGAPLYAISLQNEADYEPTYEGCVWTAEQFREFIKDYGSIITSSTKIMMPESLNFNHALSDPTLNDPEAEKQVSIIGGHLYGGGLTDYPLAKEKGKELWMTEYCYLNTEPVISQSMDECLNTAKQMNDCMTIGKMNAYVWWWVISDSNGLYNKAGQVQKRGYVMGQFAKFIKKGYNMVDTTTNPQLNLYTSGYIGDDKAVIVAINKNDKPVEQKFVFKNGDVESVTPYITSESDDISEKSSIKVSDKEFTASIPAKSVVTFVESSGNVIVTSDPATPTPTVDPTPTVTNQENDISVDYQVANDWGSGATCNIVLENKGVSDISDWKLSWSFSGNQKITNMWGGKFNQSGIEVNVTPEDWNANIKAGDTVKIGFNIQYSGENEIPKSFEIN